MNSIIYIYTYKADGDKETTLNELPSNAAMPSKLLNAAVLAFQLNPLIYCLPEFIGLK